MDIPASSQKPLSIKVISFLYLLLFLYLVPLTLVGIFITSTINYVVVALDGFDYSFLKVPSIFISNIILACLSVINCAVTLHGYLRISNGSQKGWRIGLISIMFLFISEVAISAFIYFYILPMYKILATV